MRPRTVAVRAKEDTLFDGVAASEWKKFLRSLKSMQTEAAYFRKYAVKKNAGLDDDTFRICWRNARHHGIIRYTSNGHLTVGSYLAEALKA